MSPCGLTKMPPTCRAHISEVWPGDLLRAQAPPTALIQPAMATPIARMPASRLGIRGGGWSSCMHQNCAGHERGIQKAQSECSTNTMATRLWPCRSHPSVCRRSGWIGRRSVELECAPLAHFHEVADARNASSLVPCRWATHGQGAATWSSSRPHSPGLDFASS